MRLLLDRYQSPIGEIRIVTDEAGALAALDFTDYEARNLALIRRHWPDAELVDGKAPKAVTAALDAYFAGDLAAIDKLEVKTNGTQFQEAAWAALRQIPAGATRSYAAQAAAIGRPKAMRAVGLANGSNPVAIVTPCHRVIGKGGGLTGYGGGLERKRWLLEHEGALKGLSTLRHPGRSHAHSPNASSRTEPCEALRRSGTQGRLSPALAAPGSRTPRCARFRDDAKLGVR